MCPGVGLEGWLVGCRGHVQYPAFAPSSPSWASLVAQLVKNLPGVRETRVRSLGWEDSPGEGNGNPLQYSCRENHIQRSLVGYSPKGHKELDTIEHEHIYKVNME